MQEFDRAALVKSAQARQQSNLWFWVAVAALPVVGIAAGLALGVMPSGGSQTTMDYAETQQAAPVAQAAAEEAPVLHPAVASGGKAFSARAELERYDMVTRTLRYCAETGPAAHYHKASSTYRDANLEKSRVLAQLAVNEASQYDLSAFEKDIPTDPASIMVQGMTGQLAINALQRANQFETMMSDMEGDLARRQEGLLGKNPGGVECTQFRNEVILGKHNLSLPPAG